MPRQGEVPRPRRRRPPCHAARRVPGPPRSAAQVRNVPLELVDAAAHFVNLADDGVRHGLEARLHLLQQVLDKERELLRLRGRRGRRRAVGLRGRVAGMACEVSLREAAIGTVRAPYDPRRTIYVRARLPRARRCERGPPRAVGTKNSILFSKESNKWNKSMIK